MKIFFYSNRSLHDTVRLREIPAVRYWSAFAAIGIAFAGMPGAQGQTTSAILTLTPGDNAITASGSVNATIGGVPFSTSAVPQAAGSNIDQWTGTIALEFDDPINPTTVAVVSANLVAQDSGSWEPGINGVGGPAPANYGFKFTNSLLTGNLALREGMGSLSSAPLELAPIGESLSFSTSDIECSLGGWLDSSGNIFGSRRGAFGGTAPNGAAARGNITISGYDVSIQFPLDDSDTLNFSFATATVRFVGTLNAQGVLQAPPPKLSSVGREIGGTRVRWQQIIPGAVYRVQSKDDLIDNWQDVAGTLTANTGGTIEFFDSSSPAPIQRFYRLVSPP